MWQNPESGIRQNLAVGIRSPQWYNPESTFDLESGIQWVQNPESRGLESGIQRVGIRNSVGQNPESRTPVDSVTLVDTCFWSTIENLSFWLTNQLGGMLNCLLEEKWGIYFPNKFIFNTYFVLKALSFGGDRKRGIDRNILIVYKVANN